MIVFLFIMVITLALAVCGLFLWGRKLSSSVLEFGKATLLNQQRCDSFDKKMEERLTDNRKHLFISVSSPIASLVKRIDKTDQAVRAIEKAMTHDNKVRYRADAEIAALNFSDYSSNKNLRIEIPPPPPAGGVRFKKGDLIRTPDNYGSYNYWKCHVSDKDLAVFGKITRYSISPYVLIVSYSNVMIISNHMSDDRPDEYQRLDALPEIG